MVEPFAPSSTEPFQAYIDPLHQAKQYYAWKQRPACQHDGFVHSGLHTYRIATWQLVSIFSPSESFNQSHISAPRVAHYIYMVCSENEAVRAVGEIVKKANNQDIWDLLIRMKFPYLNSS